MKMKPLMFALAGIAVFGLAYFFSSETPSNQTDRPAVQQATATFPMTDNREKALPGARREGLAPAPVVERDTARIAPPVIVEEDPERGADPELRAKRDAEEQAIHHWGSLPEKTNGGM